MGRRSLSQAVSGSGILDDPDIRSFVYSDGQVAAPSVLPRIKLAEIALPERQVRRYFDPDKMAQLESSIKKHGIISSLLLRPAPPGRYEPRFKYELVAGERRYRAALAAGTVLDAPAVIRDMSDEDVLQLSALENLQRQDLNLYEETEASLQVLSARLNETLDSVITLLNRMMNEDKGKIQQVTPEDARRIVVDTFHELGRLDWKSFVTHRLPLLKMPDEIKEALQNGEIEYTKAKVIASVKDASARLDLLTRVIAEDWSLSKVKEAVSALKPSKPLLANKLRFEQATEKLKKSGIWTDERKTKKIERLLSELEKLL